MKIILISCGIGGLGSKGTSFAKEFHHHLGNHEDNPLRTSVYAYDSPILVRKKGIFVDMPSTYHDTRSGLYSHATTTARARKRKITWIWDGSGNQASLPNPDYEER